MVPGARTAVHRRQSAVLNVTLHGAAGLGPERVTFSDATTAVSKSIGFRYPVARRLGLYAGLDVADSNFDHAFYLTIGSAWR